ncbi:Fic family protein [Pseudoalteromonas sp. NBT06-2]|uniref:Fic family protein n=1 Tax=Pseudoalteromonas sp. NBT06-2 TaxID=2025950 RepID=UPI001483BF44|nr:hypothetical protein [Pseudoalteromonas sp. NBT06-2]
MASLILKYRPTFKKNYLSPALDADYIEMSEPDSPQSPKQKYYLTQLSKERIK